MRHLIDPLDFTRQETDRLLELAENIIQSPQVRREDTGRPVFRAKHPHAPKL